VSQRGSAVVLSMFVLLLITGMGIALLFLTHSELQISLADVSFKQAYYLAEAGVEAGRKTLFDTNGDGSFDDDLTTHAGADGVINFDPAAVLPVYDGQGQLTGFAGPGDDVALFTTTPLGVGWFAAFLTNDPADTGGVAATNDTNDRVMITGLGVGSNGSFEVVQAIVEPAMLFPADVPALITIFGPSPSFDDADSSGKVFNGNDCAGSGIPGFTVPVLGLIGTPSENDVEAALNANPTYTGAGGEGNLTVVDLTDGTDPGVSASSVGVIDPAWNSCETMRQMTEDVRLAADVVCVEGTPCTLPPSTPDRVILAEGDFTLDSSSSGDGMLWVTGTLDISGSAEWDGMIVVVGEGKFFRSGGGSGILSGATIVADIAGPDNQYGTSDDCTGGTAGFAEATYDESGGGDGQTVYCHSDVLASTPSTRYRVVSFRQR
jgi:hypothetical protein